MGQNMTVPVYRGEIQARNLGMAVESWSCEGEIKLMFISDSMLKTFYILYM